MTKLFDLSIDDINLNGFSLEKHVFRLVTSVEQRKNFDGSNEESNLRPLLFIGEVFFKQKTMLF